MLKQVIIIRTDLKMGKGKPYAKKEYLESQMKMNKNYKQIASENNISKTTIQRYLNKFKLTKTSKDWTKKEIDILKKFYPTERIKLREILPNRSLSSVYRKANRLRLNRIVKPQKYIKNEKFFDSWSKEMAYVLGWVWSDGNIDRSHRSIRIEIQAGDSYILKEIKKAMSSDVPIKIRDNAAGLSIHSRIIAKSLIKLGCKAGDSLHNEFPNVPKRYFFDFLRGYLDGDGSVCIARSKKSRQKNVLRISFLGCKQFIKDLQKHLKNILNIEACKISHSYDKSELCRCTYNSKDARLICSKMYENCNSLFLKRKRNKFLEHIKLLGDKNEL